ncbi:hypothetical protein AB0N16_16075 [Streptomyces sp. NPDC051105]
MRADEVTVVLGCSGDRLYELPERQVPPAPREERTRASLSKVL